MLTVETKRHIDAARQVLVGKVPDPKQQIDQITNALIYKFMDDMDVKAKDAGGKASFFTDDLEQYAWRKLMDPRKGAQDRLNMYTEALEKFSTAQQLPQLFRDIFRQAFLPYRSPETLNLFLKEIEFFDYNHSEELGNAFEYLLSIMGSQGDAGQFRTPRQIIDFIVDIIDPDKDDKILDPACGTAGFLISAYKHIVEKHDGIDESGKKNDEKPLTHSEKQKLMNNLEGYDISSDMVKLARVNMYLHGNNQPKIYEYDSLSSEERWGDSFDVILANPPFMSPKGGIRPHNKFGVESSRAEVLFVDYIMSHLKQNGRAGIIVPEGIIFQAGKAYKQLRKNLVEDGLLAVVSLPAGVFNPYSGVKTSILIFDNDRSKKSDQIVFAKVVQDGFDLGSQRRPAPGKDDLPYIAKMLRTYREDPKSNIIEIKTTLAKSNFFTIGKSTIGGSDILGSPSEVEQIEITSVSRAKIAESGDYNLSASRYIEVAVNQNQKWPMIKLGEVLNVFPGFAFKSNRFNKVNGTPIIRIRDIKPSKTSTFYEGDFDKNFLAQDGDLLIGMDGEFNVTLWRGGIALLNQRVCRLQDFRGIDKKYVYYMILKKLKEIEANTYAVTVKHISAKQIKDIEIPLPPIELQKQIVAELDGYQKIIDGARQIIANYKPTIKIHSDWPKMTIGSIATDTRLGLVIGKGDQGIGSEKYIKMDAIGNGEIDVKKAVLVDADPKDDDYLVYGDFVYNTRNAPNLVGKSAVLKDKEHRYLFNNNILRIRFDKSRANSFYVGYIMDGEYGKMQIQRFISGTTSVAAIYQKSYLSVEIPLPPIETQQVIVDEIEAEQKLVDANKQLIDIYQQKIKDKIAETWV